MTPPAAQCPACGRQLPMHDHANGGRTLRYCSGACRARAYRARRQADLPAAPDETPLPAGARHARAVEIRQRISERITTSSVRQMWATTAPRGLR